MLYYDTSKTTPYNYTSPAHTLQLTQKGLYDYLYHKNAALKDENARLRFDNQKMKEKLNTVFSAEATSYLQDRALLKAQKENRKLREGMRKLYEKYIKPSQIKAQETRRFWDGVTIRYPAKNIQL